MIIGHSKKFLWQEKARLANSSKSRVDKGENHDENWAVLGQVFDFRDV